MKWTYEGHDKHNNHDDYYCSNCGYSEWWPTYDDPNKLKTPCPKCGQKVNEKDNNE